MSNRSIGLQPDLYQYLLDVSLREPRILKELREATHNHPRVNMQISPEQGQFMAWLVRLMRAQHCIEVGVFTGYSSLAVALALPEKGRLVACDISEEYTSIAKPFWLKAGVAGRIDLRLAPAAETLAELLENGEGGSYDFAFIDADKEGYIHYYEQCLALLRPGGVVAVDNVLWGGSVADPQAGDADTQAIRAFNALVHDDPRVELSMIPIGDGLTLARKL